MYPKALYISLNKDISINTINQQRTGIETIIGKIKNVTMKELNIFITYLVAIHSISTSAQAGSPATATVDLAGL